MPVQTVVEREYGAIHFGTNGATGTVSYVPTKQIDRTRSWSNSTYRTQLARAKRIMSAGFLPTQSYSDDLQHVVNSKVVTVTGQLTSTPSSSFIWRFVPVVNRQACSVTDPDLVAIHNYVLQNKLQSRMSGVGVSVPLTIADAGKTASMIGDAAGRLYRSYRHLKHGNFGAAARSLGLDKTPRRVGRHRSLEDNWLEYRYGWRLVVYDIQSYMKQIYEMLRDRPIVYRVTARGDGVSSSTYSVPDVVLWEPTNQGYFKYTRKGRVLRSMTCTAGYVYSLESVALATGQQLGLLNLPAVAWDLIPASFMLDWAINVSSVLEGLTAFQGKKFLDGWTCDAIQTEKTEWWTDFRIGSGIYRLNAGTEFYTGPVIERRFVRRPLASFVPASLRLDFSASFQNGLDGLALIKQVFSPRRG